MGSDQGAQHDIDAGKKQLKKNWLSPSPPPACRRIQSVSGQNRQGVSQWRLKPNQYWKLGGAAIDTISPAPFCLPSFDIFTAKLVGRAVTTHGAAQGISCRLDEPSRCRPRHALAELVLLH